MILFITHQATLTGAPILLRDFLIYFKKNTSIPFEIVALSGGDLLPDYQKIAPTHVWDFIEHPPTTLKQHFVYGIKKATRTYQTQVEQFVKYVRSKHVRLIYSNTLVNGDFLEKICPKIPDVKVLVHAHELEIVIQIFNNLGKVKGSFQYASHFIACSEAVRQNLMMNHQVEAEQISVAHSFCKDHKIQDHLILRQNLKIPTDATVVMGCGTFDWRKGSDLFLQMAKKIAAPHLHFMWVGADPIYVQLIEKELDKKRNFIHLVPRVSNARDYYEIANIFLMTSREEPFGLVGIEAGLTNVPVICFDSVGFVEILTNETGLSVPLGNTELMLEKILFLHKNPKISADMGKKLRERILSAFSWEISSQKIIEIMGTLN